MDDDGRKRRSFKEIIFSPLILLNKGITYLLKHILNENYGEVTEDDILSMVDLGNESGTIEDTSVEMINNVFQFGDMTASNVMTHRVNICGVSTSENLDNIIYLALDKGFSRIPVYKNSIDDIIGIIIVKDLLCLIGKENPRKDFNVMDYLRDVIFIPESCSCTDTFQYLTNLKSGMAVVIDEYGGTAGIVTLEDLIEAVMGDITDEYDAPSAEIIKVADEKYEVPGNSNPEEVLELFGYSLPDNHEYDTIAGFVTDLLGYLPEDTTSSRPHTDYKDLRFVVLEVNDNCISKLLVMRLAKEEKNGKNKTFFLENKDNKDNNT